MNYYTIIGNVEKITNFRDKINIFFNQSMKFPKLQTGGKIINLSLSISQINKLKKIYLSDYDLLKDFLKKWV